VTTTDPYGVLGISYATHRRADPRIAALVRAALADARTVVNVGAGAGSYEPADLQVAAVEPSPVMIGQRPHGAAPAVQASAERLPFGDRAFDAAMAVLTVHHWASASAGLGEMCRVAARQVVLTWDPGVFARFWLVRDYLPQIAEHERALACLAAVCDGLSAAGQVDVLVVPVPADCTDGFLGAYWRRPDAYLTAGVRAGMSSIALLDRDMVAAAMSRLSADLASGAWHGRYAALLSREEIDLGYRLVVAG
jgi:hypothetical protein